MFRKVFYSSLIILFISVTVFLSCTDTGIAVNPNIKIGGNGCDFGPNIFCGSPGIAKPGTVPIGGQNACPGDVDSIVLWAGVGNTVAGVPVGRVEFTQVSGNIWNVKYNIYNSQFISEDIHFSIANSLSGIPQKNGNPIPGQFQYKYTAPPDSISSYTFQIQLPSPLPSAGYYVAAHVGGMMYSGMKNSENCATVTGIEYNFNEYTGTGISYLKAELSNADSLDGQYNAWCIDLASDHQYGPFNCAKLYSTLEPIPPELIGPFKINQPENFDLVNWILNNYEPGDVVQLKNNDCSNAGGTGVINVVDIQKAIWILLDEGPGNIYSNLSDPLRVNAIICEAMLHNGYIPDCENGEYITYIVLPVATSINEPLFQVQPIIIKVPCNINTGEGATAWGDGKYGMNFPGSNWATYFMWKPTCD